MKRIALSILLAIVAVLASADETQKGNVKDSLRDDQGRQSSGAVQDSLNDPLRPTGSSDVQTQTAPGATATASATANANVGYGTPSYRYQQPQIQKIYLPGKTTTIWRTASRGRFDLDKELKARGVVSRSFVEARDARNLAAMKQAMLAANRPNQNPTTVSQPTTSTNQPQTGAGSNKSPEGTNDMPTWAIILLVIAAVAIIGYAVWRNLNNGGGPQQHAGYSMGVNPNAVAGGNTFDMNQAVAVGAAICQSVTPHSTFVSVRPLGHQAPQPALPAGGITINNNVGIPQTPAPAGAGGA